MMNFSLKHRGQLRCLIQITTIFFLATVKGIPIYQNDPDPPLSSIIGTNLDYDDNKDVPNPKQNVLGPRRYFVQRKTGDKVKIQCDARIAGFEPDPPEKVVWSLHMCRLSDSGCNPGDPVATLLQLKHVNSDFEKDQIYRKTKPPQGWKLYAEGARLNTDATNIRTAWVGITFDSVALKDSGVYRCDAVIGHLDRSLPVRRRTSYTVFTVSSLSYLKGEERFSRVTLSESIVPLDLDKSVITPNENHRIVGESAYVTCAPRLLSKTLGKPFSVSRIGVRFLPFHTPDTDFLRVAQYFTHNNSFIQNPPYGRDWKIVHVGVQQGASRDMDSLQLRIDVNIPRVVVEDSGIYECLVERADNREIIRGTAGLKVSRSHTLHAGLCRPGNISEEYGSLQPHLESDGIRMEGMQDEISTYRPPQRYKGKSTSRVKNPKEDQCVVAIAVMSLLFCLMFVYCYKICCRKKPKKQVAKKSKKKKKKDKKEKGNKKKKDKKGGGKGDKKKDKKGGGDKKKKDKKGKKDKKK